MAVPLSFAQRRLWLLDQVADSSARAVYTMALSYDLTGSVDETALWRAFAHVADRHEVLRSHIAVVDGDPEIVIDPVDRLVVGVLDVRGAADPEGRAAAIATEYAERGFDLSAGPLVRATLIKFGTDRSILQFDVHHVVFDGLSRRVFEDDLSYAYRAFAAGRTPLAPPAPRYAEFAVRQHDEWGRSGAEGLAHWRDRLTGVPPVLEFPTDRPRPKVRTLAGDEVAFTVTDEVADGLRSIARDSRTTLFAVTLAAYQYLLGCYSGSTDIATGFPFSGRVDVDAENTIGLFVNTGVLRADLSGDPRFTDLLERVRGDLLDAIEYQETPFDQVVAAVAPARDTTHTPLFQNWFDFADEPAGERTRLVLPGVRCRLRDHRETSTHFDVELHVVHRGGSLIGKLVYATELFDRSTMERFVDCYQELLAAVAADPTRPLSTARVLPAAQWDRELAAAVAPRTEGPDTGRTMGEWFTQQAEHTPAALALTDSRGQLTYGELLAEARRLARVLREHGAGPEHVVVVCLPRDRSAIVAMLAAALAGAAYLPVEPTAPDARLAEVLRDSGAVAAVTHRELSPGGAIRVDVAAVPAADHAEFARPALDDALYVVYTSGSTGTPKGVVVTHRMVANVVRWHQHRFEIAPGDRVAQIASHAFDATAWDVWPTLLAGARLDVVDAEVLRDPPRLVRLFAEREITTAFVPTPLGEALIREPLGASGSLRSLFTGGDAFRPRPTDDPGVPVVNFYGPTETSVVVTATGPIGPPWTDNSIGLPIAGARCYVVDRWLRLVPRGVVGELVIGGPGVARGYHRNPRSTADRFLPDPFAAEPGARLYRSGDLVYRRPDGTLAFVGRVDRQVKISGYRIEPAEVEAVLLRHPAVAQVVVEPVARRVLTAYVVAHAQEPTAADLRAHVRAALPEYFVPSEFVMLAALPLTSNGKLDRTRLPAPEPPRSRAPGDDLEHAVAGLLAEVLEIPGIGVDDDFFGRGGHSITALRLANRLSSTFAVDATLREVFEHRTAARMAGWVRDRVIAEISAMSPNEIAGALTSARHADNGPTS
ncbi:amino acid adenylation domain-containing protein [Actinokineospora baliensis]|uniref:non-ribosomal peptide synthetase n=1 Tax=Actinokineospora baliensis TaxID=547056 RepID=UPI001959601E|nr:non-ribosomal peptide synthetase [Actinokineospora baliensis]MBM7775501.1 amino acid adenylation domain-containing protein [Actinokineospora baliensis]